MVINKVDRDNARADAVADEIYELFFDLDAQDHHIDFPIVSTIARQERSILGIGVPGPDDDLGALLDTIIGTIPAPGGDSDAPLQALVSNLDASDYLGRLAIGRVVEGTLRAGETVALCHSNAEEPPLRRRLTQLYGFTGLERTERDECVAGDLFVVAGFPEVEIGDTLADADDPAALPRLEVDEPVLAMTFGVNTSPLAGRDGKFLTSRQIRERLDREVLGNVSIRLGPTSSPDTIEVAGRGELQLSVLIESMRREGYELEVSRPEVILKEIEGKPHEPVERVVIDVPDEHVGTVTQALAPRKGRVTELSTGETGRTIVTAEAPSRGLIGFRSLAISATRCTAVIHQHHAGWMPWAGELPRREGGAMVADRAGATTGYALDNLQKRGELFVSSGEDVYEGMVIGENSRSEEMVVNPIRPKQLTNIRTHAADEAIKLKRPRTMTLEAAIEWIETDELVEVTPAAIRIRKRQLTENERKRAAKR